ncbi:MAG: hypothetical protein E6J91_45855 [Deltaproteobacteria bacterium]|nr:MAG: hypothetical protein E6J91_45855 [Deltaproteobacteria bacterium]
MKITRKEFLERLIGGAAGVAGIAMVVGCSSSGSDSMHPDASSGPTPDAASAASCTMNGTTSAIGDNHGHVLVVSKADVAACAEKSYDIRGTSDHTHNVRVTVDMFTKLKANTSVTTTSDLGDSSHTHMVTVMCA